MAWLISDIHTIIIYLFPEELDYIFYNNTVTFNGSYLVGDSECVTVNVSVAQFVPPQLGNDPDGSEGLLVHADNLQRLENR